MSNNALALNHKSCEIVPDISLMKKMASLNGTIPSRIMELVDNSIDAKIPGKVLNVEVNVVKRGAKAYVEINDNGHGMSEDSARKFWQLGKSDKPGEKKIGRFGLGSKVAILGIGDTCKISTSPLGEPVSFEIDFDIRKFDDWKINYEIKDDDVDKHGTKIRIDNITVRIGDVKRFSDRLHEHFAKTYKHFIEKGEVEICINGSKVESRPVELLPGLYQEFNFNVNGKKVKGWAGAMKEAGTNWKFGFDLISNGRIIKANDFLSRQAHTSLARLTGEIHLDDFATDIHKTDFLRDHPDFQAMQDALLNEVLADLIAKIAKLTNREIFDKYQGDLENVSKTLNKVIRNYDFLSNIDIEEGIFKKLKDRIKPKREKVAKDPVDEQLEEDLMDIIDMFETEDVVDEVPVDEEEKKPRRNPNMGLIVNEPVGLSLGEDHPLKRWSVYEKEDGTYLTVEVNLDHPTYQSDEAEAGMLIKNAVLDSLAEFILSEEKKQGFLVDEIDRLNRLKDLLIRHSVKVA